VVVTFLHLNFVINLNHNTRILKLGDSFPKSLSITISIAYFHSATIEKITLVQSFLQTLLFH